MLKSAGGVRTERLAALGSTISTLAPEESIGDMIRVSDKLTIADTRKFLLYDGKDAP